MVDRPWHGRYLFFAQACFAALLIPVLMDPDARFPIFTSAMSGVLLLGIGYVYYERRLGVAVISSVVAALLWFAVAIWRH